MIFKFNKDNLANALLFIFLSLVFVAKVLNVNFLLYPAIIAVAASLCLGNNSFRVGACLLLVPNIRLLDSLNISFGINLLIALPVFIYLFERRRVNFAAAMHVIIIEIWDLAHSFYFGQFNQILPNLSTVLVLYYVECVLTEKNVIINYADITRKFCFGCIYSGVLYMIHITLYESLPLVDYISLWRLYGYAGDPNYFSLYLCVGVAMLFIIKERHKIRDYFYMLIMIGITLLTASKMSLVTMLLILLYFAVYSLYSFLANKNRFAQRIVIIGAVIGVLFSNRIADIIKSTVIRIREKNGSTLDIDTITSNRFMIQNFYFAEMLANPMILLFGYGLQYNETAYFRRFFHMAHNTYMDIILSWGIPGLIIVFAVFFSILRKMRKIRTERLTLNHFLPLVVVGLTFLALSCLSATMFWWMVCAVLLPLKGLKNESANLLRSSRLQRTKIHFRFRNVRNGTNVSKA